MKKILAGFIMDGKSGGVDKYLLNFLEAVHGEDVRIDFLTNEVDAELRQFLQQYHSRLFPIAGLKRPVKQFSQVCRILEKGQYDMVYLNVSTAIDCIAAFAARRAGVEERAIHSHSSGNDCEDALQRFIYNTVHRACRLFFYRAGTRFYGCSHKAGRWIFPNKIVQSGKFEVIYNAVDRLSFSYDPHIREVTRSELGLENKFVVGHIGNFRYAKNYPLLIDIFEQIYRQEKKAVLLLAGTGDELEVVRKRVSDKGLGQAVMFLGWRPDTYRLYQAMDVFLLPSRFEGLPIVGVEAQCTKLQCVLSDEITDETKIQDQCYFLSLKENPKSWADFILGHRGYDREKVKLLREADNYDLESQRGQLRRIVCH